jgi:hypothetical protein
MLPWKNRHHTKSKSVYGIAALFKDLHTHCPPIVIECGPGEMLQYRYESCYEWGVKRRTRFRGEYYLDIMLRGAV